MTGAMSRNKGAKAERDFVAYLRSHGFPEAERSVATGYTTPGRQRPDQGDVVGTPVAWQVKSYASDASDTQIGQWLVDAGSQAQALGVPYGLLVVKRNGKANPDQWWCWMHVGDLVELMGHDIHFEMPAVFAPVRLKVQHAVLLVRQWSKATAC